MVSCFNVEGKRPAFEQDEEKVFPAYGINSVVT